MTAAEFRRWYESRGLSQVEVARLLGVYQSRVTRMALGKVPVSRQTAYMLALIELVGWTDWPEFAKWLKRHTSSNSSP